ncbi:MAG: DEAD/DEAH box helicase [Treponema sp.]|nr:DEAD/DEAH box helicase [Candidatus Treponema equifaecale]
MNYSELNLNGDLYKGIENAGYVSCTPVQEKVLTVSLDGTDLYVQSQTGSGKTAAFLLTIMQQLMADQDKSKNALVLVPTRELAVQVEEEARKLAKFTRLRIASFFGGVGYEKQIEALKKGVDILIGTPGRVIDLEESKQMDLSHIGYLAIDEADRMFDMGFYPDLRKLIKVLPTAGERQTMLFSATLNSYVKNLAYEYTENPVEITIEAQNITVDEIDQELIHVSSEKKLPLLMNILNKEKPESLIIFCNTKRECEYLSRKLHQNDVKSEYIMGDLPQKKRQQIMDSFKAGKINILVATDVAARGIDVNDLAMVINWDLPNEAENYVHRIGRTARAGKSGKAYTFCSEQDVYSLMPIERYIEKQIPSRVATDEDYAEVKQGGERKYGRDRADRSGRNEKGDRNDRRGGKNRRNSDKPQRSGNEYRGSRNGVAAEGAKRQDELDKLSKMTSDERAAYYREKFSGNKSKAGNGTKSENRKSGNNAQKGKGKHNNVTQNKAKARSTAASKAQGKKSEKKGLFAKLKSLFGR